MENKQHISNAMVTNKQVCVAPVYRPSIYIHTHTSLICLLRLYNLFINS